MNIFANPSDNRPSRKQGRRVSVAPMMGRTDRFCRYFLRLITRHSLLYTEMITVNALIHGDAERLLAFDEAEHPVALQLGGSDPVLLARAARMGEDVGYDEINLNVGCPSGRVKGGGFGACLMGDPQRVADCVAAMRGVVRIPVTVKCRIGIDDQYPQETLPQFIEQVCSAGCRDFIIHGRKAWLEGLSPAQNRTIPPLDYSVIYGVKAAFPNVFVSLNGGVGSVDEITHHLKYVDGVMVGRAAYETPWMLASVDESLFGDRASLLDRPSVIESFMPFAERERQRGVPLHRIVRHVMGLFAGQSGARAFRRYLTEQSHGLEAEASVLRTAVAFTGAFHESTHHERKIA
ncbi:MAG: tRNA dihydrouridine(20/20a) synthase DusA [Parvularculales bacterium]